MVPWSDGGVLGSREIMRSLCPRIQREVMKYFSSRVPFVIFKRPRFKLSCFLVWGSAV